MDKQTLFRHFKHFCWGCVLPDSVTEHPSDSAEEIWATSPLNWHWKEELIRVVPTLAPLYEEYKAKDTPLWMECVAKRAVLAEEYSAKVDPLWAEYDAQRALLDAEYDVQHMRVPEPQRALLRAEWRIKCEALMQKSLSVCNPLYKEHIAKLDPLWAEYQAARKPLFYSIFPWPVVEAAILKDSVSEGLSEGGER